MQHDVIDNRNQLLIDHIRRILPTTQAGKFAVGYFFLSGLESVADVLENVGELRLLIGNTSNRDTIEQIAEGYRRLEQVENAAEEIAYPKRVEMEQAAAETVANIGETAALMDQTDAAEQLAGTLVRLIEEDRLHVRVYTKGRLHAKAYIFDYGPVFDAQGRPQPREENGIAIVGSSNFTLAGVTTNTELNVIVHGNANHAALTRWYEELWTEAQDFEDHLMRELRQSWPLARVTPYEIYLKTLYELVREQLEGAEAEQFLWRDDIAAVLTDFQDHAVRRAIQMIHKYGGCFVSDVVGLGKSYIGAAIVKHFERRYLKVNGAIGFYHPDFVAVQETPAGEVNWIIETKGREYENVKHKDQAIRDWCQKITAQTGQAWDYVRVPQVKFDAFSGETFDQLLEQMRGKQAISVFSDR